MLKTIVTGRVGSVKFASKEKAEGKAGFAVLNFTVASNATTRSGERITNWVACKLWGNRASALSKILKPGATVAVEGRPEARAYLGESGPQAELTLHVTEFEFLSGRPKGAPEAVEGEKA